MHAQAAGSGGRWPRHAVFVALGAVVVGVGAAGAPAFAALAYFRPQVLDGEVWRLVTAHLVHAGPGHLGANLGGLALVWAVLGRRVSALTSAVAALVSALAASVGVLVAQPRVHIMAGLSAVTHGLLAAGAVTEAARGRRRGRVFLALLAAKLVWDQVAGALPRVRAVLGSPLVPEAHLFAALAGALCALWLPDREGAHEP